MRKIIIFLLAILLLFTTSAACETLRYGMSGETVAKLQQVLIEKGYLTGAADGIFGSRTEKAVRAFQKKNSLKVDGLAGTETQKALFGGSKESGPKQTGFFSNDYSTILAESENKRIMLLQKALIRMNYLKGSADGIFGNMTKNAVLAFQREHSLKSDGVAGRQTLTAMEEAIVSGYKHQSAIDQAEPLNSEDGRMEAPEKSSIELLHWYKEVKPKLKSNAKLVIYDPATKLFWTLKVHSKGRHCDAEPVTLKDTQVMMKAFGNKNSWTPKGVYVLLPDGRWTIGATHNVPHLKSYIQDNGFDGVLCVHFFRDMDECSRLDPNYGVQNQRRIRAVWKTISGETVD